MIKRITFLGRGRHANIQRVLQLAGIGLALAYGLATMPLQAQTLRQTLADVHQEQTSHGAAPQTEQRSMLGVARAYLDVVKYRRLLELSEANVRSLAQQVAYRNAHYERKLSTRTELAQTQARQAEAQARQAKIRAELKIAESVFLRDVGSVPGALAPVQENSLPDLPENLEALLAEKASVDAPLRQHISEIWWRLQAARHEVEAYLTAVEASKVAYEGVSAERDVLGELTLMEVLNAEQEVFQFEVALVHARFEMLFLSLELLEALGRLESDLLGLSQAP